MKKILFIIMVAFCMVGCKDEVQQKYKVTFTNSENFELSCHVLSTNSDGSPNGAVAEFYIPGNQIMQIELDPGKYDYWALGTTYSTMLRYVEGSFTVGTNNNTTVRLKTEYLN